MSARNLTVLFFAQLIGVSTSVTTVQLGGIAGSELAARPELATLPLSFMIIGTALATVPAALLMQRIGRRRGFAVGALIGAGGLFLAAAALKNGQFALFCVATAALGFNLACVQQYRFAAAESVEPNRVSRAISLVLLGSIGGAFVGPRLISQLAADGAGFAPVFAALSVALVLTAGLLFIGFRDTTLVTTDETQVKTSLTAIVKRRGYALAVAAGATSYGVMTFVMTATPLSMHLNDGHTLDNTGWVITAHVLAMYLPSLFSGQLIDRYGAKPLMLVGLALLATTIAFGLSGRDLHHYTLALVCLGVGWNFLYVGATTALVTTYNPVDRYRAQAFNEFCVFASSAMASLLAGLMLHRFGWGPVLLLPVPLLMLIAFALLRWPGPQSVAAPKTS